MLQSKIDLALQKIKNILLSIPNRIIIVDTSAQQLHIVENGNSKTAFNISTSKYGIGNREGSNMTPPGVHRIEQKIGKDAPPGRIFRSRIDTGTDWHIGLTEDNLILTRILRLRGLEPGINSGPGIDSYERYIYIHGTNQEDLIGTPNSHGCVCMKSNDIISLFDAVEEGTIVVID
ncbi:MAG TPA: L,D-transpeptidase [Chitinispirillaceae bacterium]|nr:L,D-transpeptidase [Chitinispirillaceae bacterium]